MARQQPLPEPIGPSEPEQEQEQPAPARRWPWQGREGLPSWVADGLGVLLLALALLTLWGLLPPGTSQGVWLAAWIRFWRTALGWGAWAVPFLLAHGGLSLLMYAAGRPIRWRWGRWLLLELAYFAFLALLSLRNQADIGRALAGYDGGLVGWALASWLQNLPGGGWWAGGMLAGSLVLLALEPLLARLARGEARPRPAPAVSSTPVAVEDQPAAAQTLPASPKKTKRKRRPAPPVETPEPEPPAPPPEPRPEGLPPLDLLAPEAEVRADEAGIQAMARRLEEALAEFDVPARVVGVRIGPSVVQFAVEPGYIEKPTPEGPKRQKVRVAQILSLRRDLALALAVKRLRIQAPVPGRPYVGVEVPNPRMRVVRLRPLLESPAFRRLNRPLALALGRDTAGEPVVADLAAMPHLLVAGATGSGKSIFLQALTLTLVMNLPPKRLRLVLIDPKRVEMNRFQDLPHLLGPVEVEPKRILAVLQWLVAEMQRRYRLFEQRRVRDIESFHQKYPDREMSYIVVVIDELADLMMHAAEQVEAALVRLAQLARATGIHLVVATQRPSVDVITGLIKANFPARIAFQVAAAVDSRVILDQPGAEALLGRGDMLFLPPDAPAPIRVQGPYVDEEEIRRVVDFWKAQAGEPTRRAAWEALTEGEEDQAPPWDPLLEEAARIVVETQRANTSLLQRRLRIGYPRAARIMDQLERLGIVGPAKPGRRDREVLVEPGTPFHLGEPENPPPADG